jgi:transposase
MSTSLLYHAWGFRGYRCLATDFVEGHINVRIQQNPDTLCCSHCGGREVMGQGVVVRRFKTLPIGSKPVWLELPVQRLWCPACGKTRQAKIGFADPKVHYTRSFERYALDLSSHMTLQAVAQHLGVSWDVVKGIQKRYLQRRFARIPLQDLRQIAIDEISIGKGHRYLTVVLDLESGAVIFLGEGKGAEALKPLWRRLRRCGALKRIEAVATDMSPAYALAVREHLPGAVHVLDRFHVVKLFNDQLAGLRREVQRSVENVEHKQLLKGTLWLLLKNPENLNEERHERRRLEEALRINQPLATAYYLKEDLRQFWEQPGQRSAARFLEEWIARAQASGVAMLQKFAKTLQLHRAGLLAWYDYPISTGPLEGTNNKIKTMQRQAYGYRDQEFFRLKIYAIHEATYALVG